MKDMQLIRANEVTYDELQSFLSKNEHVNGKGLIKSGYVAFANDHIIGCFNLESSDAGTSFWLRRMYIIRKEAALLPVILEAIIQLARLQEAKQIYVKSHQPVVDLLLESLQFSPQSKRKESFEIGNNVGNIWTYSVS